MLFTHDLDATGMVLSLSRDTNSCFLHTTWMRQGLYCHCPGIQIHSTLQFYFTILLLFYKFYFTNSILQIFTFYFLLFTFYFLLFTFYFLLFTLKTKDFSRELAEYVFHPDRLIRICESIWRFKNDISLAIGYLLVNLIIFRNI